MAKAQIVPNVEQAIVAISMNSWNWQLRGLLRDPWMSKFIDDVSNKIAYNTSDFALTTAQAAIALKAIRLCSPALHDLGYDVEHLVEHPVYRVPVRESLVIPREVRHLGGNLLGFRFKLNEGITRDFKRLFERCSFLYVNEIGSISFCGWDHVNRIWVIPVCGDTIEDLMSIISVHGFNFDDEVLKVLAQADEAKNQPSGVVVDPDTGDILVSVCDNELLGLWVQDVLGGVEE